VANIIPKEQLSAYQRWEMDSFQETDGRSAVSLPTAEAIEAIQHQARQEGYQEGLQEGRAAGHQKGYADGKAQAEQEATRLNGLMSQLDASLAGMESQMAETLLDLALGVAKQMLRQALAVRPELILPIIQEAINRLPQTNQHPQLFLNPQDAALVRAHLDAELAHGHWRIQEDNQIAPGGCRLETAQCELDASIERRWQDVLEALGQSGAWLTTAE
jgi:flagellar assembly protein FliH